MQLSGKSIHKLCAPGLTVAGRLIDIDTGEPLPMISPYVPTKRVANGKSYGLSVASYDLRIAHDLTLRPSDFKLAHTLEDFALPLNVSGQVCDKSTYARLGLSCFNTFFDPGFKGNGTLELVNLSPRTIEIKAGDPICQMVFFWIDGITEGYSGKYQHQPKEPVPAILEGTRGDVT